MEVDDMYPRAGAVHWEQEFLPKAAVFLAKRKYADDSRRRDAQDWGMVEMGRIVEGSKG